MSARLAVTQLGVRCGVGRSARLSLLGWRTGSCVSKELALERETVRVITDPDASVELPLEERVTQMASKALAEACSGLVGDRLPVWLYTSARVQERVPDLLERAAEAAGVELDRARSRLLAGDGPGFVAMLAHAARSLAEAGAPERLVVGAVDSQVDPTHIADLLIRQRVASAVGRDTKAGTIVPSEGAAFLVLATEGRAQALAHFAAPACLLSKESIRVGPAVAELAKTRSVASDRVLLIDDCNGQRWRNRRVGRWIMNLRKDRPGLQLRERALPAELGDMGAANAALGVALASLALSTRAEPEPRALVLALEDTSLGLVELEAGPERVAALPPATRPTSLARAAGRLLVATLGAHGRFRAIQHRVPPRRREPIERSIEALSANLAELEQALPGADCLALVDSAKLAATELSSVCAAAAKSEQRRKREPEPRVVELGQLALRVAARLEGFRNVALGEAASMPETRSALTSSVPGPYLSRGLPSVYAYEARTWVGPLPRPGAVVSDDDEEEEDDDEEEEDDDASPSGAAARPRTSESEDVPSRLLEEATGCLDAIALHGQLRLPPEHARWAPALEAIDQQLLVELDRLHALAAPLEHRPAPSLLADLPVAVPGLLLGRPSTFEPGEAFASTLVLACTRDPRALRAAARKATALHPDLAGSVCDALSLGSAEGVAHVADELALDDDATTARVGLEVMARRREVSVGSATLRLYDADPTLRRAAARALGFARHAEAAVVAIESRLQIETDPRVALELIEALLRQRAPHADALAARGMADLVRLGPSLDDDTRQLRLGYAQLCAALGRPQEAVDLAAVATTPSELECLGWFGRVTAVDPLLRVLERGEEDDPCTSAASRALVRILGAAPDANARSPKLVRVDLATVPEDDLVLAPKLWRAHWEEVGAELGTGSKLRFGRRFDVAQSAREHNANGVRVVDRRLTSLELALAGPKRVDAADERDWVARQVAMLPAGGH